MSKRTLPIVEYVNWLLKKYQEIQKELQAREAYRIVSINNDGDECLIKFHIVGAGKEVTYTAHTIAADDTLLEGFSKKDIRTITFYACQDLKKPAIKITEARFSEKLKKVLFRLKKKNSEEILEKSAAELSSNPETISSMSPHDAHSVGYAYGTEHVVTENEEKRKLKEMQEESKK